MSNDLAVAHSRSAADEHPAAPNVDDTDLAILEVLLVDARTSQRQIAREIGMSPPAVAERIARLERAGVIRGYHADVDLTRLGHSLVVYVSVVARDVLKNPEDVLRALRGLPEVEDVAVMTGPMDLLVRLRVRDHEHLRKCLFDGIWKLAGVNRTETFICLGRMAPKHFGLDLVTALRRPRVEGTPG
ncbi:MAG: Lrp/AsnC family transcriptional regulator [Candidatus Dormibacteraceae bacterium]